MSIPESLTRDGSDVASILAAVGDLAANWGTQRDERQRRRSLDPRDFQDLRQAGVHLMAVPVELGGIWHGTRRSTRPICEILRTLAHGDPSVALVCTMHAAVLQAFLLTREAPDPWHEAWKQQRRWAFQTVLDGAWWGTLVSEPGKANDRARKGGTVRTNGDGSYRLTGQRHFGTGSGVTSFMITQAVPAGESDSETFILDVRGVPWDGSAGMRLVAEWDGHGMQATQSHAFEFADFPAIRIACPEKNRVEGGLFFPAACAAVVVGVVETALEAADQAIRGRGGALVDYERVEWTNAQLDGWLIKQAYEGMLRVVEDRDRNPSLDILRAKASIAQLAESALLRICRIVGARTFNRSSPFGFWFEDVRALGFLRPSWRVAYDDLIRIGEGQPRLLELPENPRR